MVNVLDRTGYRPQGGGRLGTIGNEGRRHRSHIEMSPVPASAITIADGEITVDAGLLAPKLRLWVVALKAEVRKDNVYSVAETGIDEDAGRTRVTFRYAHEPAPWWSNPTAL
jgi:hypothetical protein